MFSVHLRRTIDTDIGCRVLEEIFLNEAFIGTGNIESLKADCKRLQCLRERAVCDNVQLVDLESYAKVLTLVVTKFRLPDSKFAWSNSLGCSEALVQGDGIWFEFLNVVFNLGAKFTNLVAPDSNTYKKAAGAFHYARTSILPKMSPDIVPSELQASVLEFLENLFVVRAADLEVTNPSSAMWPISVSYARLLDDLASLPVQLVNMEENIRNRMLELQSECYLMAAEQLKRSRKIHDHLSAKNAILICLRTGSKNKTIIERANSLLNEPLGRRKNGSLADLDDTVEFDPEKYFTESASMTQPDDLPSLAAGSEKIFQNVLPYELWYLPLLLHFRINQWVKKNITSKLRNAERRVRTTAVKFSLPAGIEIILAPSKLPQSLLTMSTQVASNNGMDNVNTRIETCRSLILHLRKRIDDIQDPDKNINKMLNSRIEELEASLDHVAEQMKSVEDLVSLLRSGSDSLVEFLKITTPTSVTKRTKPTFLTRLEAIDTRMNDFSGHCHVLQSKVLDKLVNLNMNTLVSECSKDAGIISSQECYNQVFDKITKSFSEDLIAVQQVTQDGQVLLASLVTLQKDAEIFRKQSIIDVSRNKAVHALEAAWSMWLDSRDSLTELESNVALMDTPITLANSHSEQEKVSDNVTMEDISTAHNTDGDGKHFDGNFMWTPGRAIKII